MWKDARTQIRFGISSPLSGDDEAERYLIADKGFSVNKRALENASAIRFPNWYSQYFDRGAKKTDILAAIWSKMIWMTMFPLVDTIFRHD